jgi:hypothetical protein
MEGFIAPGIRPEETYKSAEQSIDEIKDSFEKQDKSDVKFEITEVKKEREPLLDYLFNKIDFESLIKAHRNFVGILNEIADGVYNYFARIKRIFLSMDICREISLMLFDIKLDDIEMGYL